jgi:hypothetical protein
MLVQKIRPTAGSIKLAKINKFIVSILYLFLLSGFPTCFNVDKITGTLPIVRSSG